MSSPTTYTDQQEKAIRPGGSSLALRAGAGCGKTFVLTERFLKELESDTSGDPARRLSELVAITFTDAAARELRTRIRRLVYDRIANSSGETRRYWLELQRAIDNCRISTIHSLCGKLLRDHAFDVGLDPLFATLDAPAAAVLEAEAIEDTLRRLLTARDGDAMLLGQAWNVQRTKQFVRAMMPHYRRPAFAKWTGAAVDDVVDAWRMHYAREVWQPLIERLQPVSAQLAEMLLSITPENEEQGALSSAVLAGVRAVADGTVTPPVLVAARQAAVLNRKPFTKSLWPSAEEYDAFRQVFCEWRETYDEAIVCDFDDPAAGEAAALGLALARLTHQAAEAYQHAKDQRNALDFEDLLAITHKLLSDPDHRKLQQRLQRDIGVLFVDEFQDTDRVQLDMVQALVGDIAESGKLFFVGDEKQSIYRFRGAEPQVFIDLQQAVLPEWRLPLSRNFRSQPAILHFVNTLFEPFFEGYQALDPHRPQVAEGPTIEFLWTDFGELRGKADAARRAEARRLARRIRELIDGQQSLIGDASAEGGARPADYGDVAILFRSLSDIAAYEEALRGEDIPYYLMGGHAFYTQQEIYDVLHLLRVVASQCDELSLAGVLRSPFFSLADETLFWLAVRHGSLERGLFASQPTGNIAADEQAKVRRAADTVATMRAHRERWTVPQLLSFALEQTGFDAVMLAEFMGERKLANVYKLVEQARAAVASGVGSLDEFVTQLDEFTTSTPREALATTSPGKSNVVRLMTVHMSKGLEFPIVAVADLNRQPPGDRGSVAYTDELGPLVKPASEVDEDRCAKSGLKLFKHAEKPADDAESDRLFYVACTRAADYLLLSAALESPDKLKGAWMKRLAAVFDLTSGTLVNSAGTEGQQTPAVAASLMPAPPEPNYTSSSSTDWLKVLEKADKLPAEPQVERSAEPHVVSPRDRRRFSVTRLSGQIIPSGGDWWRDDPEAELERGTSNYDPLGFGTLVHAMLERVELGKPESYRRWAAALAPQHDLLHIDAVVPLAEEYVERFADSDRARDMREALELHHEVEFTLPWPPGSTDPAGRYLQGYIDCLYQSSDSRWHVVDYKTNQVSAKGVGELAEKYELQMLVYGLAVESFWGVGPSDLVLHFLRPGAEHVVPWDDAARERAIALVSEALERIDQGAAPDRGPIA